MSDNEDMNKSFIALVSLCLLGCGSSTDALPDTAASTHSKVTCTYENAIPGATDKVDLKLEITSDSLVCYILNNSDKSVRTVENGSPSYCGPSTYLDGKYGFWEIHIGTVKSAKWNSSGTFDTTTVIFSDDKCS